MEISFDDIRPYNKDEFGQAFDEIFKEKAIMELAKVLVPHIPFAQLEQAFKEVESASEFQKKFVVPFLGELEATKTEGITDTNIDSFERGSLLISNHRDIIMDSAFIDFVLFRAGNDSVEIGIGDNLLVKPWIKHLVRINKSFIVKRNLPAREMPKRFLQLSAYIRYAITAKQNSVWIAQREGRAKDSNDVTQESLLKMFALSGTGSFIENLKELRICPVTLSYEYDPCDYLKAKEFQQQRDDPNYNKTPQDDIISMGVGVMGYKGHININFCPCINSDLDVIASHTPGRKDQITATAQLIDNKIHHNYKIYPINKIAYDELLGTSEYGNDVTPEEQKTVHDYLEGQLQKIDLPQKDQSFLRLKLLEMYANPLINYLKTL